jgi:hypothetical protein
MNINKVLREMRAATHDPETDPFSVWADAIEAEIERLKSQNTRLAGRIGCGCGGDYGLCNECAAALAGEEEKR